MSSRDSIHPVKRQRREGRIKEVSFGQDFGTYQVSLLAATQIAYMPIAASLLSTTFMKTSEASCELVLEARRNSSNGTANGTQWYQSGANGTGTVPWYKPAATPAGDFLSLLSTWDIDCTEQAQTVQTAISTTIMVGALVGAAISGYVADRYGRKPVVIASLALCSLSNGLLLLSSLLSWPATLPLFFLLGGSCGGYMTTNLVLVIESLCRPSSRLLVVALNGWSLSMAATALLGFLCPNWLQYHLALSVISSICAVVLFVLADESLRWLKSSKNLARFDRASDRLVRFNGGQGSQDIALLCQLEKDGAVVQPPVRPLLAKAEDGESGNGAALSPVQPMSYLDLMKERTLRPRLLSLGYIFFSSSVTSFGCYYAIDSLSGNRCANLAIAGGGKFILGLLPFVVSSCVTRKQVALISVAAAGTAVWVVLVCLLAGLPFQSALITVLSLVATAALDPNWKISHLYSTELFPTSMRNMARGFVNSLARIGSVLSPLISHLRHDHPQVTFGVFAALLTAQFAITAIFLPHQAPSDLQDAVPAPQEAEREVERRTKEKRSEYEEEERSRDNSSQLSETAPLTP